MQRIRAVDVRRDIEGVLAIHERQTELREVVNVARGHVAMADGIAAQRYRPDREREEVAALRAQTVAVLAEAIRAAVDRVPEAPPPPAPPTDHAVQLDRFLHRLNIESTAAGVSALLRESEQAGLLDRLWPYAGTKLRSFAADEQRRHVAPSSHSAFTAWSMWSARMGHGVRGDGAATRAQRQRELRERGLAIADVTGLRSAVEAVLRRQSVPEPATPASGGGSIVMGRYWEQRG